MPISTLPLTYGPPGRRKPNLSPLAAALIDANEDEIIYKMTFNLSYAGLAPPIAPDGVAVVPHDAADVHAF
jgi:hypothetical protein